MKGKRMTGDSFRLMDMLNQILQLDYSLIVHYPRLASASIRALDESERLKTELLPMISHDLRNPLASIKGCVTTLLQPDVMWSKEKRRDLLEEIDRETDQLTSLVSNLLFLALLLWKTFPPRMSRGVWFRTGNQIGG